MAEIAGVDIGAFALPENDTRQQQVTLGEAWDNSFQFYKFGASRRVITIPLRNKTTAVKNSLATALEADANYQVTIDPDSHIDLGAGAGTAITAQWIDSEFNAVKTNHDAWSITLNFVRVV